ncbi:hypothetical protein LIER_05536 [Lithospermum erythrorhizon]|uniref:Uncharacterized protein n=1 Tax=Lithospermum erythrorhizon TaxID=34254 RepID=A0AAV3P129_LITER
MGSLSIVPMGDKAYTHRRAYLLLEFDVSPPPAIPPEMVSTLPMILGDVSIFPLDDNSLGLRGDLFFTNSLSCPLLTNVSISDFRIRHSSVSCS